MVQRIAVVYMQNKPPGFYSGGPYYSWLLAYALEESGFDATLFADNIHPVFEDDLSCYKQFKRVHMNIRDITANILNDFDCVIAVSSWAIVTVSRFASELKIPLFNAFVDFKTFLEQFDNVLVSRGSNNVLWKVLYDVVRKGHIMVLGNTLVPYMDRWLGDRVDGHIFAVSPAINSRVFDEVLQEDIAVEDEVIVIGRNTDLKNFDHVLYALKRSYEVGVKPLLNIVTNDTKDLMRKADNYGINIKVHIGVSDREKFRLIRRSKFMVNASLFEGWGLWLQEGMYGQKMVLCYDIPTFHEISQDNKGVIMVKYGDREQFMKWFHNIYFKKCKMAAAEKYGKIFGQGFTVESMGARLRQVITEVCI
jgi:hypothetical protein|tara:strand:+ start:2119 stop:3210 length:1092 start_codon:yes stop_codon:yes gene_type:complete